MHPTIFITGASGMFGRDLVPYLLTHSDAELVLLAHRREAHEDAGTFLERCGLPPRSRIRVVHGDIGQPDLGLSSIDRTMVRRFTTHIIHSAACTRFDQRLDDIRETNVEGTRHVGDLAKTCSRLEQFAYISTAYVSGRRTGVVRESELEHAEGFVNTYEQSKYEAELLLKSLFTQLPTAVYRLSTVFGDSRTGAVRTMTAPHLAIKIIYHGLAAMMPGSPDYRVDLIPGDVAAATVGHLFLDGFENGTTYHVTANPEKSYVLADLIDAVYEAFAALDPQWERRRYPKPVLASRHAFELFMRSVEEANDTFLLGVLRSIEHFAHQLTCPKVFDRTNVKRVLPNYDDDLPDIREYCGKVVKYCLQTRWGKRAA